MALGNRPFYFSILCKIKDLTTRCRYTQFLSLIGCAVSLRSFFHRRGLQFPARGFALHLLPTELPDGPLKSIIEWFYNKCLRRSTYALTWDRKRQRDDENCRANDGCSQTHRSNEENINSGVQSPILSESGH
jgi:hypothetical protein